VRLGWTLVAVQFTLLGVIGYELLRSRRASGPAAILGVTFGALGGLIATLAAKALRCELTAHPAPTEGAVLRSDGLYGVVRHPIYSGLLLAGLGAVLIARTRRAAIALGALTTLFSVKSRFEEHLLRERFPEYEAYAVRVPRFAPRWPRWPR